VRDIAPTSSPMCSLVRSVAPCEGPTSALSLCLFLCALQSLRAALSCLHLLACLSTAVRALCVHSCTCWHALQPTVLRVRVLPPPVVPQTGPTSSGTVSGMFCLVSLFHSFPLLCVTFPGLVPAPGASGHAHFSLFRRMPSLSVCCSLSVRFRISLSHFTF